MSLETSKIVTVRETVFKDEMTELENLITAAQPDDLEIEAQRDCLRSKYQSLIEVMDTLKDEFTADGDDQKLLVAERKCSKFIREMSRMESKVDRVLVSLAPTQSTGSTATSTSSSITTKPDAHRVNLPQRKLQEFCGDARDWLSFWSSFEDIDLDKGIQDADKFQYLLQCVPKNSDARKVIDGFTVSAKNYGAALQALKDMYGRPRVQIKVFVRDLLELVIENATKPGKQDFMDLYPKLSSRIRNLSELGVTSDKCGEILYPVVESCLPEDMLKAWQRCPSYDEKLDELMKFLNTEVHNKMDRSLAKMSFGKQEKPEKQDKNGKRNDRKLEQPAAAGFVNVNDYDKKKMERETCVFCGATNHESEQCGKAKLEIPVEQKMAILKEKRCCYRCLRPGHTTQKCRKYVRCIICGGHHFEIICSAQKINKQEQKNIMMAVQQSTQAPQQQQPHFQSHFSCPPQQNQAQQQSMSVPCNYQSTGGNKDNGKVNFSNITEEGSVTLQTLIAILETPRGRNRVRVFIDNGSEVSYILTGIAQSAGLPKVGAKSFRHQRFGGDVTELQHHSKVKATLVSLDGSSSINADLYTIPRIARKIRKPQFGEWVAGLAEKGIFFHDQSDAPDDIQVLIGMDILVQIKTGGFERINETLVAEKLLLGWVLGGIQPKQDDEDETTSNLVTIMLVNQLNPEDLWSLEAMGIHEDSTSETKEDLEKATIEFFEKTVQRNEDGRYVVHLPWKEGHRNITSNYGQALSRLNKTTAELKRQGYWDAYDKIFRDWEEDDIIIEVKEEAVKLKDLYLLPHRHVVKENSSTTPVRPVFDASAKGRGGPSLNDCLATGPNLLELIPAIMCRFRKEEVGAVSDIRKAFLQIQVTPKDQEFLQFLWWNDSSCTSLKLYRHQRVVFGVKPSPFLLAATLKHHLLNQDEYYKMTADQLLNSLYVDNSCSSHSSIQEAVQFKETSQELLLPAQFDLRGWEYSGSKEEKIVAVLGMNWETREDTIMLCMDSTEKRLEFAESKRGLLSLVNSLFDPMGFICAFTLIPKLLLQDCCKAKLGWDDALPSEISVKLAKWKSQVPDLKWMKIPRWLGYSRNNNGVSLHCFTDASGSAFATSIYLRVVLPGGGAGVQLVMSKSRVAPYKNKVSIPRLELLGCGIGARLTAKVRKYMELEDQPVFFWTDSSTALTWIIREKEWARFVENRVKVIRQLTRKEDWYHVPGEMNPADIPSRGCSASYLIDNSYWNGPDWLRKPDCYWPNSKPEADEDLVNMECKKTVVACHNHVEEVAFLTAMLRFSDYHQALRVLAFIRRFVSNLKKRISKQPEVRSFSKAKVEQISYEEMLAAEKILLKMLQQNSFDGIYDKRIVGMGAFRDQEGIIRIKSQLLFGNDDFNVRCPIVLPHDHPLVKILIYKEHCINSHAGVQVLQAILRERFWILRSRRKIGGIVTSCPVCRRFNARRCEVPSAPLPVDRIRETVAFDVTGVDLAGPLHLRGGQKIWIVLFTCGVYRAVHLELVTTLSTQGFMNALRRFVARRGRPSRIYSDNGLNFKGTANLFKEINWTAIQTYAAVERISWRFNPPTAAWWGGWWERLVGLTKQLIRRVLGKRSVEYDELNTILCDVEATLNQRPLTYISDKKDELLPLCPVQFMRDNPNSNLPEADYVDSRSLRNSVKICQTLREALRTRFRKEYLGQLQHHAGTKTRSVKPGDVVIIEDDNKKRLEWSLGIIKEVYPGRDGQIRTALVKTKDGEFLRAVQRLFIMEISDNDDAENEEVPSEPTEEGVSSTDGEIVNVVTRFGRNIVKPVRLGV